MHHPVLIYQPGIERGQALADISRSALCCHINETRAPTANPANSAQLRGTSSHSSTYIWDERACGRGQTDTQTAITTIHFASSKYFPVYRINVSSATLPKIFTQIGYFFLGSVQENNTFSFPNTVQLCGDFSTARFGSTTVCKQLIRNVKHVFCSSSFY